MTVNAQTGISDVMLGDGVNRVFPFGFKVGGADEVTVYRDGVAAPDSDFTVSIGLDWTGDVTFGSPPAVNEKIQIASNPAFDQKSVHLRQGPFFPDVVEDDLDRSVLRDIYINRRLGSAFHIPEGADPVDYAGLYPVVLPNGETGFSSGTGADAGLRLDLATGTLGALLIAWRAGGVGSVVRTLFARIMDQPVSVLDYIPTPLHPDIAAYTSTTPVHSYVAAAMAAHRKVMFPDGLFVFAGGVSITNDGQHVVMSPGTIVQQTANNTTILSAINKNKLTFEMNGALLRGEGTFKGGLNTPIGQRWTGNGGHLDRAIDLSGCDDWRIVDFRGENFGHSNIAIFGGTGGRMVLPKAVGTLLGADPNVINDRSDPNPENWSYANFQIGLYFQHHPVYGAVNDVIVTCPDVSGTTQGVLVEWEVGAPSPTKPIKFISPHVHDIAAQHAFYLTSGMVHIVDGAATDILLSAYKVQAGDANGDIVGIKIDGYGENIGSHLFEVAVPNPYTGVVSTTQLKGVGRNIGGRGLSINRRVENLKADLLLQDVGAAAVSLDGTNLSDIDVTVQARGIGAEGLIVTATGATGIKVRPTFRNPNTNNTNKSGILVENASATVDLYYPDVTDAAGNMVNGLFNSVAGGIVRVHGSATFTGASAHAVRAIGKIPEFPTNAVLQSAAAIFNGLGNISSAQPRVFSDQSNSASSILLFNATLDDDTAWVVNVYLVGKSADGSQRRAVVATGLVYRDGGAAALQGAVTESFAVASGGFAGAYALTVAGNDVQLLVNSGGASTYFWQARVTITRA
ncbi:MAG: hypothetical protein ACRCWJ_15145 [Casimicrobium sp.]